MSNIDRAELLPGANKYSSSETALNLYNAAYEQGRAVLLDPSLKHSFFGSPENWVMVFAKNRTEQALDSIAGEAFIFKAHVMATKVDEAVKQVIAERGWSTEPFREADHAYYNLAWLYRSSQEAARLEASKAWSIDPNRFMFRNHSSLMGRTGFSLSLSTTALVDIQKPGPLASKEEMREYYEEFSGLSIDFAHKLGFLESREGLKDVKERMAEGSNALVFLPHPELSPFKLILQASNPSAEHLADRWLSYASVFYSHSEIV